jgi:DNA-binding response OmpR family regulator
MKTLMQSITRRATERILCASCAPDSTPENILIVGIPRSDRSQLQAALGPHACPQYWVSSIGEAVALSNEVPVRVVICDTTLPDGTWRSLWKRLRGLQDPPGFIVSSRSAVSRIWAKVLDLNGSESVLQPFELSRMLRVVQNVCGAS